MAIATLDEISNQRAILGVGAGISGFAELGIVRKKPAAAMRETIHMVRVLLKGETVDYHGDVIGFPNGKLSFKPVQGGHSRLCRQQRAARPAHDRRRRRWRDHGRLRLGGGGKAFRAILAEGAEKGAAIPLR